MGLKFAGLQNLSVTPYLTVDLLIVFILLAFAGNNFESAGQHNKNTDSIN